MALKKITPAAFSRKRKRRDKEKPPSYFFLRTNRVIFLAERGASLVLMLKIFIAGRIWLMPYLFPER